MNFAILDDNYNDLNLTFIAVKDYMGKYNIEGSIFTTMEASKISEYVNIDCYILDVILPNANGVELSHLLIKRNLDAKIIFISSTSEYSPPAHQVKPLGYLIKPIDKKQIFMVLDELMKCFNYHFITIKDNGLHDRKIYTKDILYISPYDYKNNTLILFTDEKKIIAKMTYKQWIDILDPYYFVNAYKNILVNVQNIISLTDRTLKFKDGSTTTCSKKYIKELEQRFFDYLDDLTWHR